jgi:long-chain-fatty-acid--[acyl-carrier-protein] ligase
MNLILLSIVCFLGALGLGFAKFFALGYLSTVIYTPADKAWIIQAIGALMTLGPVAFFPVLSIASSVMRKKWVMAVGGALVVITLLIGSVLNWAGSVWIYLFVVGVSASLFNVGKIASVPLEAEHSGKSTYFVNAVLSVLFVIGILSGIVLGTSVYEWHPSYGIAIAIGLFATCALLSVFIQYPQERCTPVSDSVSSLIENTVDLLCRYPLYLLSAPLLWGAAGAISLAITAYAEAEFLGTAVQCSLMSLYAAAGTILGNAISPQFVPKRYRVAALTATGMALLTLLMPILIETGTHVGISTGLLYWVISGLMMAIGVLFGICTNLIDAEYLQHVGAENKEGSGAALHSIGISLFSLLIGSTIGLCIYFKWLSGFTQFFLLSAVVFIAVSIILLLGIHNGALRKSVGGILRAFVSFLIKRRYRITLKGLDSLPQANTGTGVLFLPNHPAEIDPAILGTLLWNPYQPRPVVTESFYHMKGIHSLMQFARAFPMPDLNAGAGFLKKKRMAESLLSMREALDKGENVMVYPSGKLMRSGKEALGSAAAVEYLLQSDRTWKIVLVRTVGLWGSSFSTEPHAGQTPDFGITLKNAFICLLRNCLFFVPKRSIEITFSDADTAFKTGEKRQDINARLEAFYNEHGEEPVTSPSYSCFKTVHLPEKKAAAKKAVNLSGIPADFIQKFMTTLAEKFKFNLKQLNPEKRLNEDLGLDSLAKAELLIWLEETYEVAEIEMAEMRTLGDLIVAASGRQEHAVARIQPAPAEWHEHSRPDVLIPTAKTIPEAFLKQCDRMGTHICLSDEFLGVLRWKDMKRAVLIFADSFQHLPGEKVGVLLPAGAMANIICLSLMLAKKTPVMLNWTVGRKNLEHAAQASGLEKIISSARFLDKLESIDLGNYESHLIFLEEWKTDQITLGRKLIGVLQSFKKAPLLAHDFHLQTVDPRSPAVILFTSGSESAPKGVPLSHANLLANIRAVMEAIPFDSTMTLYGFLPPFHSFGFALTSLMPMLGGLKAVYSPNPTESRKLAQNCARWGVSILCGTPTFVGNVFKASQPGQLDTLRLIVTGAEKLTPSVTEFVKTLPAARIIEGYGITECSPVISANRLTDSEREGVGQPISSVTIQIVSIEDYKPLPQGERGLILVNGESIFYGYLGGSPNPFVSIEGENWYNTGDLGYLTESGSLVLAGRMKRFVKIGGEMISLPAIEEALTRQWPAGEDGPVIAVEAIEYEDRKPDLLLFTSAKIELDAANEALKAAGLANLCRLRQCIQLKAIPILGTGKTDYQTLKKLAAESVAANA